MSFSHVLCSCLVAIGVCASAAQEYQSPDFAKGKLYISSIDQLDRFQDDPLARDLVGFSAHLRDHPDLQARCLLLAWCVAGQGSYSWVASADLYYRNGEIPDDDSVFERLQEMTIREHLEDVMGTSRTMATSGAEDTALVVGLTRDVLSSAAERGIIEAADYSTMRAETAKDHWNKIEALSGSTPEEMKSMITPREPAKGLSKFQKRQSTINGLLVVSLSGSEFAGGVAKMNATLVGSGRRNGETIFEFSQDVGKMMESSLTEAGRFVATRNHGLPEGETIEISFEERDSIKDGPSGAVACALLIHSLLTGEELDPGFAVTGDMNADGVVQSVGGIDGKIRGSIRAGCNHVAIPGENVAALYDMALLGQLPAFTGIQVFSISSFDEARNLALPKEQRPDELNQAMALFSEVQKVIRSGNAQTLLANLHVQAKLREVVSLAPNHESAKLLYRKGTGTWPRTLSLAGSFMAIDRSAKPLISLGKSKDVSSAIRSMKDASRDIKNIRSILDPRTKDAADALDDLSTALGELGTANPARGSARYNEIARKIDEAVAAIDSAYSKLHADPEVQAELNF